jgi:uncharacterized protein with PQ loop repeat
MVRITSQFLGLLGIALGLLGYLPQVSHLLRQQCSAGVSVQAYLIWLSAAILLLSHAIAINDGVFILLQGVGAGLDLTVVFFATKYRGQTCPLSSLARLGVRAVSVYSHLSSRGVARRLHKVPHGCRRRGRVSPTSARAAVGRCSRAKRRLGHKLQPP